MDKSRDNINKDLDLPGNLEDAERFQRLFVTPMIEAVRTEVKNQLAPVVEGHRKLFAEQERIRDRLNTVERMQKKALVGYGVFASGLAVIVAAVWDWIKSLILGNRL
jgi:Ni,Fe-hydrogenase III large subunit